MSDANQRFLRQHEGNKNHHADEDRTIQSKNNKPYSKFEDQLENIENKKLSMSLDHYRSMPPPVINNIEIEKNKLEIKQPDTLITESNLKIAVNNE